MTALVTEYLPLVAGAPDGIERLRTLILDVAIQGLLSSQTGSGFADESTQPSVCETVPFRLPPRWHWSTVGDECVLENGDRSSNYPNKSCLVPRGVPFINAGHLNAGRIDLDEMTFISRDRFDMLRSGKVKQGDLLYCLRGSLGKVALVDGIEEGAIASSLVIVRPGSAVVPRYLLVYFNTSFVAKQISTYDNGTAQPNLSAGSLRKFVLPVPSPEEQHRIVAKVDELMALCDRLEADQADAEAAHAQLVQALLDSLTQATDAADFRASWQRLSEHFHTLFTTEASIDALKQTVLQLAVMGKVVPQDPSEGEARKLIDLINVAKVQTSVRARKDLEPVSLDHVPFDLPANWVWARIGQLALSTEYGLSEKTSNLTKGVPVLKMGDIQGGGVALDTSARVPEQTEGLPELYLESGDLLYNRTNSAELVGKTGIYSGPSKAFTFASYLIRIRFDQRMICPSYINYVMNSPAFRQTQIDPHLKQQCGQANVNGTIMRNMLVSLPPFAEQQRIVAKVDELMALCDELKAQLAEARQQHTQLASLLVAQAVAA